MKIWRGGGLIAASWRRSSESKVIKKVMTKAKTGGEENEAKDSEANSGRKRLTQTVSVIESLRTVVTGGATLIFAIIVGGFIVGELLRDAVLIEPIHVPAALEKRGFSSEVLGRELLETVLRIRETALTAKEKEQLAPGWTATDIDVPGTDMSVHSVIRFLKRYETRIGGAVTEQPNGSLRLRLRASGQRVDLGDVESGTGHDLDELLELGGREVMLAIDPFILAAYLYFEERDRPGACRVVRHNLANETEQDDAWAYNLWGLILADYGYERKAIQRFKQAIELRRDFVQPLSNWGLTILNGQEKTEPDLLLAEEKLRHALKLESGFPLAHINLALLLANKAATGPDGDKSLSDQELAQALSQLERAIQLDPRSPDGHIAKGMLLGSYGGINYQPEAISGFRRALELDPNNAKAYFGWGMIYRKQGDSSAAMEMFRQAVAYDIDFSEAWAAWASALLAQKRPEAATARMKVAASLNKRLKPYLRKFQQLAKSGEANDEPFDAPGAISLDRFDCPIRVPTELDSNPSLSGLPSPSN